MPAWQPNKPSWTHQPTAPTPSSTLGGPLNGPASMVGDITRKSWASTAPQRPSGTAATNIGIANKSPNLFSDLLGSNLGAGKGNSSNVPLKNVAPVSSQTAMGAGKGNSSNVPLKNVAPVSSQTASKSAYSMGGMADSLPKYGNLVNSGGGGNWGSSQGFGNYNTSGYGSKNQNLGGPSMPLQKWWQ